MAESDHNDIQAQIADPDLFYKQPILNSPYEEPDRHWELDKENRATGKIIPCRRPADFITPIQKPRKEIKGRRKQAQGKLETDRTIEAINTREQQYDHRKQINEIRQLVSEWRGLEKSQWKVTPVTARLLEHWRTHEFSNIRPFFCQIEAVETAIWLTEVAPKTGHRRYLEELVDAASRANGGLPRLALKMATGSGKTTVMAMLIAWQALNALRGFSRDFSRNFLVVAPGITIRDRLRELSPNDPKALYATRELVPQDMLKDLGRANVIITNYHAFKRREKLELSKGTRAALAGWREETVRTLETDGEMLQRVIPGMMGARDLVVINDEAHHCYREKPGSADALEQDLQGLSGSDKSDARKEASERAEAARLWISGLEVVQGHLGIRRVFDLSATPFFLSGSGYAPGTIFPWTISDFSLMDAIEAGIVKVPRVPVSDNVEGAAVPMYRNLWDAIKSEMRKKRPEDKYDPLDLPAQLTTAIDSLYGHYEKVFDKWSEEQISVPPCFIIVCNNTYTSKLIYDYISGFRRQLPDGSESFTQGRLPLFRNFDENGEPLPKPVTLLIDSAQLERGDALDAEFAAAAKDEIARFKREILERQDKLARELRAGKGLPEAAILREVMNTVGKKDSLGAGIRCVVSVGMLTEGWDANNVTHILGVRAFGTQLLCEQVIGRALRRQSYDLQADGKFAVEYSDIFGIPLNIAGQPTVTPVIEPKEITHIEAVLPQRAHLEITFPRVTGYRMELPAEKLAAAFSDESLLLLTQEITGATDTTNSGIIGESVDLTLEHLEKVRVNTVLMHLTRHLLEKYRDGDGVIKYFLYGQLRQIVEQWYGQYFHCEGGTYPGQLLYRSLAERACEKISDAITSRFRDDYPVEVILDPYAPLGTSSAIDYYTSKRKLWTTDARKCQINYVVTDSDWEAQFCRIAEKQDNHIAAYVKNDKLGFGVPYHIGGASHRYLPDFILKVDDGRADLLNLIVEIKGYRGEDAVQKKATMENYWLPGVNNHGGFGRWDFLEIRSFNAIETELTDKIARLRAPAGTRPEGLLV